MQGGTVLDLKSPVYLIATYIRTPQSGIPVKASDSVHLTPRRDYILKSVSASESGDRRMIVSVRRAVAKRSQSCEDSGSSAVLHSSTAHAYADLWVACRWEYLYICRRRVPMTEFATRQSGRGLRGDSQGPNSSLMPLMSI